MAEFNGDEQQPTKLPKPMAKLGDDLVLEIVARLPLKKAMQCATLNKSFHRCIAGPSFARLTASRSPAATFYCSGERPKIYSKLREEIECTADRDRDLVIPFTNDDNLDSKNSVNLDRATAVMASCNGLLLLHFGPTYTYYVYNPMTGGLLFVDFPVKGRLGLAVDFASEDSHFKLVSLHVDDALLTFTVLAPIVRDSGLSMVMKSRVEHATNGSPVKTDRIQPVYAHGSLYWLADGATVMVSFNVEKLEASVNPGPIETYVDRVGDKWFGLADGLIRFVYVKAEEIVIRVYNHWRSEWGAKQRIPTLSTPTNNDYGRFGYGEPVLYDAGRLYFLVRKRGEHGHVYAYNEEKKEWELSWTVAGWTDAAQHFFQYAPSIARVSRLLVSEQETAVWNCVLFANCFRKLKKLMAPAEILVEEIKKP